MPHSHCLPAPERAEPKMGECTQRTIHDNGALINEFLELARSFASPVQEQVGLPPQIRGVDERTALELRPWITQLVRHCDLENF